MGPCCIVSPYPPPLPGRQSPAIELGLRPGRYDSPGHVRPKAIQSITEWTRVGLPPMGGTDDILRCISQSLLSVGGARRVLLGRRPKIGSAWGSMLELPCPEFLEKRVVRWIGVQATPCSVVAGPPIIDLVVPIYRCLHGPWWMSNACVMKPIGPFLREG